MIRLALKKTEHKKTMSNRKARKSTKKATTNKKQVIPTNKKDYK